MRGIRFKKSGICLLATLLVLICIPLLSLFSDIDNGSIMQDTHTAGINQDSVSPCGADKDAWRSIVHQNSLVDLFVNETDFSQSMQRLLNWENNSRMAIFYGLPYSFFFRITPSFISPSSQILVCIINYFLIAPYSPNAPPYILA